MVPCSTCHRQHSPRMFCSRAPVIEGQERIGKHVSHVEISMKCATLCMLFSKLVNLWFAICNIISTEPRCISHSHMICQSRPVHTRKPFCLQNSNSSAHCILHSLSVHSSLACLYFQFYKWNREVMMEEIKDNGYLGMDDTWICIMTVKTSWLILIQCGSL